MDNQIIKIDPEKYGLPENKAKEIKEAFLPMLNKMEELEKEYNEVIKLPVSKEACKKARELRLQYVKTRTGTAAIHKEVKAYFASGVKFVDGWRNTQLHASQGKESALETIEKHYDRIEKERLGKLQDERNEIYKSYGGESIIDFTLMDDEVFKQFIAGSKVAYEERLKAEQKRLDDEKKVEAERIEKERVEREEREAKEKAEAEEKERIRLENEKLKKEAEEKEAQRQRDIAEQQRIEKERIEKEKSEKKERERVEAEHKAKLEEERKKQEAKLEAEKKERERVEAELKTKEEEERKRLEDEQKEKDRIENEKIEKERKESLAPDKVKLQAMNEAIQQLVSRMMKSTMESKEAASILNETITLLNSTSDFLDRKQSEL